MSGKRRFDEQILVSGQIDPSEIEALVSEGVAMIVNNRPDGEDPGQPSAADIEAAAERAGAKYRHVPIARGIGPADVESMEEAIEDAGGGTVLAFCRTGNRSSLVSALVRRRQGRPVEQVVKCLTDSGGDPSPIAHLL